MDTDEDAAGELAKELVASDGDFVKGILVVSEAMSGMTLQTQSGFKLEEKMIYKRPVNINLKQF